MKQSGFGRELGPGGPGGLPGHEARAHRDEDRAEGVVVPLRGGPTPRRRRARASGARQRARRARTPCSRPVQVAAAAQLHLQVGEHAERPLERRHVGLLARAIIFLLAHGGPLSASAPSRRACPPRAATRPGAPRAACARSARRACSAARRAPRAARRAPACRAGRPRRARRPGRRRRAPCRVAASRSHVRAVTFAAGCSAERDLLELARQALLARARRAPTSSLAASWSSWRPELARVADAPLGQLPRLRGGVLAHLAAGLLDRLRELLRGLAARNQDQHGFGRQGGERLLERRELGRLPGADVVHQQVASGGLEAQRRERAGHLARLALTRVEDLEPARPALVLGPAAHTSAPGVDLGVVVSADEVGGLQGGHRRSSGRSGPRPRVSASAARHSTLDAGSPSVLVARCAVRHVSVTVPSRSVR